MNQGATASAWCQPDPGVRVPKYAFTCRLAPGDDEAWIEVLAAQNKGDLIRPTVDILAGRPAATHADYRKPYVVLPPRQTADQELLDGINALRARAGVAPLHFAAAQSRLVSQIQKATVQIQAEIDDHAEEQIRIELLKGRAVEGPIRTANITLGIAYAGDAGDWLAARMTQPSSRQTLMDPDADLLALAAYGAPNIGFGVSAVTYTLFDGEDEERIARYVSTRIATARGELKSKKIATATELTAAAEEVATGKDRAPVALRAALLKLNRRSKEYFEGVALDMPWDWEDLKVPAELLEQTELEYGVLATHGKNPEDDWHHGVVFIWYRAPRPTESEATF